MQVGGPITTVKDPTETGGDRIKAARKFRELSQQDLAKLAGVSNGTIGNVETNARKKPYELSAIARALRTNLDWLERGVGSPPWEELQSHASRGGALPPIAQQLSVATAMIGPTTIEWESIMSSVLPHLFRVTLPDDAMAPEYRRGTSVVFSTQEGPPRPDDVVLVADADDNAFFRVYQERRPGHWQAVALASGYQPLDSSADGLRVLAIAVGKWGRRG